MLVGLPIAAATSPIVRLLLQHTVQQPKLLAPALLRSQMRSAAHLASLTCKVLVACHRFCNASYEIFLSHILLPLAACLWNPEFVPVYHSCNVLDVQPFREVVIPGGMAAHQYNGWPGFLRLYTVI